MATLFGVDVAGILAAELGPGMLAATLTVVTPGVRNPADLAAGTNATTAVHACRGIIADYTTREIDDALIKMGDRKVTLLAKTISGGSVVPKPNDKVTIEGATYRIVRVERDAAASHYDCQVRA